MGNHAGIVLALHKPLSHSQCYLISEKLLRRDKVTISDLPKVSGEFLTGKFEDLGHNLFPPSFFITGAGCYGSVQKVLLVWDCSSGRPKGTDRRRVKRMGLRQE